MTAFVAKCCTVNTLKRYICSSIIVENPWVIKQDFLSYSMIIDDDVCVTYTQSKIKFSINGCV